LIPPALYNSPGGWRVGHRGSINIFFEIFPRCPFGRIIHSKFLAGEFFFPYYSVFLELQYLERALQPAHWKRKFHLDMKNKIFEIGIYFKRGILRRKFAKNLKTNISTIYK